MNEQKFSQEQDLSQFSFSMTDRSRVEANLPKDIRSHFWSLREEVLALCQRYGVAHPKDLVLLPNVTLADLEQCEYLTRSMQYMLEKKELPPLFLKRESEERAFHYGGETDDEPYAFELPHFAKTGTILDAQGKFVVPGQMANGRWVLLNHQGRTLGSPEGYEEMGPMMQWNRRIAFAAKERGEWSILDQYGAVLLELPGYRQVMNIVEVDEDLFVFAQAKEGQSPWKLLNQFGEIKGEFRAVDEVSASKGRLAFIARTKEDWPDQSVWQVQKQGIDVRLQKIVLPTHSRQQFTGGWPQPPGQEPDFPHPEIKQVTCVGESVAFGVREKGKKYWSVINSMDPQKRIMNSVDLLAIREAKNVGGFRVARQIGNEVEWFFPSNAVSSPHCTELVHIFSRPGEEIFFSARFSPKSKLVFPARVDAGSPMGREEGYTEIRDIIRVSRGGIVFAAYEKKNAKQCGIFDSNGVCLGAMDRVDTLGALDDGRFYAIGRVGKNIVKQIFDLRPETK